MNKLQYKRLLSLRYNEELMFQTLCRLYVSEGFTVRELINDLGMNHKRARYLLSKWSDEGIYDYGVNIALGWFTD